MGFDFGEGKQKDLVRLGKVLDAGGEKALALTKEVLSIRNRLGTMEGLAANEAQRRYQSRAGKKNIVLKARQMGVTTWIAGRFFLRTILHPGTVSLQVAHTQAAAEQIFRIVHRFFDHLPSPLRSGALQHVRRSAQRIVFPELDSEYLVVTAGDRNAGRGITITNLHCTELARWPGDAAEILYGLMATLSPEGELVLESTPNGASGCFWKEWQEAEKTNTVRHFFPWWLEEAYQGAAVEKALLTEVERKLIEEHTEVTPEKIGYRRQIHRNFRGLAKQEYAEDANECFLASGECLFDLESIRRRLKEASAPVETRRNGQLRIWMRPERGRNYVLAVDPAGGGSDGDYLQCSIGNVTVEQQGPMWVTSTPASGTPFVRRLGTTAQGADCTIERTGKLRFYPASTPQAGELIAVSYRTSHRSVARLASAASIAAESNGTVPGTACWMGTVTSPAPRSSADCENAASAILAVATSRAAAWKGKYTEWNADQQGDVWPGDVLAVASTSAALTANLVVREVQIDVDTCAPGLAKYSIAFANDWADELAIKTSSAIPADVWLPQQPETVTPLANLNTLAVTSVTGSQIQIAAGVTPPAGGGFEVRRRDWSFTPGPGPDLVLRSPVPNFTIPRQAAIEQYYIRMYDGSTPPNYSRFSNGVFVNLPLSSS